MIGASYSIKGDAEGGCAWLGRGVEGQVKGAGHSILPNAVPWRPRKNL